MPQRIGFVCFSSEGHLNPSLALAAALADRGHQIVFYSIADGIEKISNAGFDVRSYGDDEFTLEFIQENYRKLGTLTGMSAVRMTVDALHQRAAIGLRDFPALFRADRLDGLIVDQIVADGATVARSEGIPYVTVSNALPINLTNEMPPVFSHGLPGRGAWPWLRNRSLNAVARHLAKPILAAINRFQRQRGLTRYSIIEQLRSDLAHITQIPRSFDFPQQDMPPHFHYTGPFHNAKVRPATDFPWRRVDPSRPLVYLSMGTLQNQIRSVFGIVAEACQGMQVQLVVSLGGGADATEFENLPGNPIVVSYAPQLELLDRAALCITHAGLNTTMESLARGLPMLAIPVTNDQPGVAARIEWSGTGRRLSLRSLTPEKVRQEMETIFSDPRYRQNAQAMRDEMIASNGLEAAAEIVEKAILTQQPVVNV